ncbi:MAG: serine/threonine protein kinase [Deltaproteobacteria bacterium]|nr:serine/threonine protein kinase [Deltaproteobacteria bacterium]
MSTQPKDAGPTIVGRYRIHAAIAHGGMATVHLGRLLGPAGFARTVAIKRLHAQYARDPEFGAMFLDEARLASRIRHPHVVSIVDVIADQGELLLVMDYIEGEPLSHLLAAEHARGTRMDPRIAAKIAAEVLSGLHAAHELRGDDGALLQVVHRDVSPQNILVGVDGVAHLIDFGVAKAAGRLQTTRQGELKGKLAYMAPEQIRSGEVDRRTDVYATSAVLWEMLVGRRLFAGAEANLMFAVLTVPIQSPRAAVPELPEALDAVVMKGLKRNPDERFASAQLMADALESSSPFATSREVSRWIQELGFLDTARRARMVEVLESGTIECAPLAEAFSTHSDPALPAPPAPSVHSPLSDPGQADSGVVVPAPARARFPWLVGVIAFSAVLLAAGGVVLGLRGTATSHRTDRMGAVEGSTALRPAPSAVGAPSELSTPSASAVRAAPSSEAPEVASGAPAPSPNPARLAPSHSGKVRHTRD